MNFVTVICLGSPLVSLLLLNSDDSAFLLENMQGLYQILSSAMKLCEDGFDVFGLTLHDPGY